MGDAEVAGEEAVEEPKDQAADEVAVDKPQDQAADDTKATSDEALLKDPSRLLGDYKELQRQRTKDLEERDADRRAIEFLKGDKDFQDFYKKKFGGQQSPQAKFNDDDILSVKDARALAESIVLEKMRPLQQFVDDAYQREANRERDELFREFPDAEKRKGEIREVLGRVSGITMREAYKIAVFDELLKAKKAGNADRASRARGASMRPGNGKNGVDLAGLDEQAAMEAVLDSYNIR